MKLFNKLVKIFKEHIYEINEIKKANKNMSVPFGDNNTHFYAR